MASLAHLFRDGVNEAIFEAVGEVALIDGKQVQGIFNRRYREVMVEAGGAVVGVALSFDCSYAGPVVTLREGDPISIDGERFCFRRRIPEKGDETGRVTLELGNQ